MVPDDDPKNMAVHYEVERFRGLYSHAFMSLGVEETAKVALICISLMIIWCLCVNITNQFDGTHECQ